METKHISLHALANILENSLRIENEKFQREISELVNKEIIRIMGISEEEPKPQRKKKEREKEKTEVITTSNVTNFEILPPGTDGGLDTRLAKLKSIGNLTGDLINKFNISPILIANTVNKRGNHPFYCGSAAYIWYLPQERRNYYLAKLFAYDTEYPTVNDLIRMDENKEKWEEAGVDIDFVTSLLTESDTPVLRDEPKKDEDPSIIERVKALGGFGKMTQSLGGDAGPKLVRFMCRFGINQQVLVDLLHILQSHKEEPNVYIV